LFINIALFHHPLITTSRQTFINEYRALSIRMSDRPESRTIEVISFSMGADGPTLQRISGSPGEAQSMISALFSGESREQEPPAYDFGSAHFDYDVYSDFPPELTDWIVEMNEGEHHENARLVEGVVPVETVVADMLRSETSLQFNDNQVIPHYCTTRCALDFILKKIVGDGRIALPLPNWHFWEEGGCTEVESRYSFDYFPGRNEDQLIEGFKSSAMKDDVKALILVDPANPLMYRISEACARELDDIALRNGVDVIVDDVLRGVQPIGDRDTIARHFTRPYVIEGFSKRFGDAPLGYLSYILLPEDKVGSIGASGTGSALFGTVLGAAMEYSTEKVEAVYRERNAEFDRVMNETSPGVKITRPSDTHIVTLLEMPPNFLANCSKLRSNLWTTHDLVSQVMFDHYPPGDFGFEPDASDAKLMRIAVGMMEGPVLTYGTRILGSGINVVCNYGLK